MPSSTPIETALDEGDISTSLFKGSTNTTLINDLQRILFELGFKRELKIDQYQVDGDYGPATTKAVAAFATKNKVESDGKVVTNQLAELMLQRHSFLPEMYLLWSIDTSGLSYKNGQVAVSPTFVVATLQNHDDLTLPGQNYHLFSTH